MCVGHALDGVDFIHRRGGLTDGDGDVDGVDLAAQLKGMTLEDFHGIGNKFGH